MSSDYKCIVKILIKLTDVFDKKKHLPIWNNLRDILK